MNRFLLGFDACGFEQKKKCCVVNHMMPLFITKQFYQVNYVYSSSTLIGGVCHRRSHLFLVVS